MAITPIKQNVKAIASSLNAFSFNLGTIPKLISYHLEAKETCPLIPVAVIVRTEDSAAFYQKNGSVAFLSDNANLGLSEVTNMLLPTRENTQIRLIVMNGHDSDVRISLHLLVEDGL